MKNIRIKDISKKTGIDRNRISLIERGMVNPSFDTVAKIAECLDAKILIVI